MKINDLTGQFNGPWAILHLEQAHPSGRTHWMCQCSCGTTKVIAGDSLKNRILKSCGCGRSIPKPVRQRESRPKAVKASLVPAPPVVKASDLELARLMRRNGASIYDVAEFLETDRETAKQLILNDKAA